MTKIRNLGRLKLKLAKLPDVAKRLIRSEMEAVAEQIVTMMKGLVAVDDGALRDSIGWTWGKAPKGSMTIGTISSARGAELTLTIYAGDNEAYYARWVEFGTAAHVNAGQFSGTRHPGTAAQPFFYVSWRANRKAAKRQVRKAVRTAAKQVAAGS